MSQQKKKQVLSFLQCAYSDAKRDNDVALMNSLARATVALNYSGAKKNPTLADMLKEYRQGQMASVPTTHKRQG